MKKRVRALLVDENNSALFIKRSKPGEAPYWVLPGGGVEGEDVDLESALNRELREELDAEADIDGLIWTLEQDHDRQFFYLARLRRWSFDQRSGPEFSDPSRGNYEPEFVALNTDALQAIDLKPDAFAAFLIAALADSTNTVFHCLVLNGGMDIASLACNHNGLCPCAMYSNRRGLDCRPKTSSKSL